MGATIKTATYKDVLNSKVMEVKKVESSIVNIVNLNKVTEVNKIDIVLQTPQNGTQ